MLLLSSSQLPFKQFVSPDEIIKIKNTKCRHECSFKLKLICTVSCDGKKHTFNQWGHNR